VVVAIETTFESREEGRILLIMCVCICDAGD